MSQTIFIMLTAQTKNIIIATSFPLFHSVPALCCYSTHFIFSLLFCLYIVRNCAILKRIMQISLQSFNKLCCACLQRFVCFVSVQQKVLFMATAISSCYFVQKSSCEIPRRILWKDFLDFGSVCFVRKYCNLCGV